MKKPGIIMKILLMFMLVGYFLYSGGQGNQMNSRQNLKKSISPDQVIQKYLSVIGGEEKIKKINSKIIRYRVFMIKRGGYLMEQIVKRPGLLKIGRPGSQQFTLYDGKKAWRVMGKDRMEMKGRVIDHLKKMTDLDGPFIDWKQKGTALKYIGTDRFEFSSLYHIKMIFPNSEEKDYYFETDSGLLVKLIEPSFLLLNNKLTSGPDNIYYYYDYRDVDGIKFPFLWVQTDENLEHMHVFVVESIGLNEPIDDVVFKRP